ncbi:NUDIX domain-containing protein [Deinococcus yavapaiensis]|uniref:ADP-ribose pyrophosphatase n=1 Tax=Deinococcus yavapaiensis KR-236 TaxID=694435 RepID=A0A318S982_9DEIO|nr:NUDIX hydrolase [Deinococcus yavapaiensis]PYE55771.1 ADP-ribose pyrophosphatase [Deinococcus yavapaiensis KR-236]
MSERTPDLHPDDDQPWTALERRDVSRAPHIVADLVQGHAGTTFEYTYRPRGGRAALIVPITEDGRLVMLRQYRYPIGMTMTEIPAGAVELGEEPLDAAKRELAEEIGGVARAFEALPLFCPQPSFTGQIFHPFVAFDVTLGENAPEDSELLRVEVVPIHEAYRRLDDGEIPNGPSALTLFHARRVLSRRGLL